MNVVYMFGNGFDLNLGLKTRYVDFYKNAYQINETDNELIKSFKGNISEDIKKGTCNWSDLEKGLGEYTNKLKNEKEFDILFDNIRGELKSYISKQENLIPENISKELFFEELISFKKYLRVRDKYEIDTYIKSFKPINFSINVISFNYTSSFEKLANDINSNNSINAEFTFDNLFHIHGTPNDRFILGVDNIQQISNEDFKRNENIRESILKPVYNYHSQKNVDIECEDILNKANIICLFGLSLGETDQTWWKKIGVHMANSDMKLIIFWKNKEKISTVYEDKIARMNIKIKDKFLNQTSINSSLKPSIKKRIYIVHDSKMLSLQNIIEKSI